MNELQKKVLIYLLEEYLFCQQKEDSEHGGTRIVDLSLERKDHSKLADWISDAGLESAVEQYFDLASLNKLAQKWIKELGS